MIIGSGGAGLSAAIQFAKRGARVVVLEKLGFVGGTTSYSNEGVWTTNASFNKATGFDFTPDSLVEHMYNACEATPGSLNDELIRRIGQISGEVYEEYKADGAPWETERYTLGDALEEMPVSWPNMFYTSPFENSAGMTLIDALEREARMQGVDIRLNSRAVKLIMEEKGVSGVEVEGREFNYRLLAKKTVLATGGFQRNEKLVAELAPDHTAILTVVALRPAERVAREYERVLRLPVAPAAAPVVVLGGAGPLSGGRQPAAACELVVVGELGHVGRDDELQRGPGADPGYCLQVREAGVSRQRPGDGRVERLLLLVVGHGAAGEVPDVAHLGGHRLVGGPVAGYRPPEPVALLARRAVLPGCGAEPLAPGVEHTPRKMQHIGGDFFLRVDNHLTNAYKT